MTLVDHAFAAAICVLLPAWVAVRGPRWKAEVRRGGAEARRRFYRHTIAWQWTIAGALLVGWLLAGRPAESLGLSTAGPWRTALALGLALLLVGALAWQYRCIARSPDLRVAAREQIREMAPILPEDEAEFRRFRFVAVTAGFCEELMYRGFLLHYATELLGPGPLNATLAVVVAGVAFGACHAYQGVAGMVQTGAFGLIAGGLALISGGVGVPMLMHALQDLAAGRLGVALAAPDPAPPPSDGAS